MNTYKLQKLTKTGQQKKLYTQLLENINLSFCSVFFMVLLSNFQGSIQFSTYFLKVLHSSFTRFYEVAFNIHKVVFNVLLGSFQGSKSSFQGSTQQFSRFYKQFSSFYLITFKVLCKNSSKFTKHMLRLFFTSLDGSIYFILFFFSLFFRKLNNYSHEEFTSCCLS